MGIEYFDFSIATGANRQIDCRADFVRYMSGSAGGADESIIIKSAQGGIEVKLKPGQSFKIDTPQVRWFVQGVSGNTVIGEILFSEGAVVDDSSVAGTVTVIDGGKNMTNSGKSFMGMIYTPAVAAQFTSNGIFNPSASGINVFLKRLIVSSVGGCSVSIINAALANISYFFNAKNGDLNSSLSQSCFENNAVRKITSNQIKLDQGGNIDRLYSDPILIKPGKCLLIEAQNVNDALTTQFEFIEEKV